VCGPTKRGNAGEWKKFVLDEGVGFATRLAMAETIEGSTLADLKF